MTLITRVKRLFVADMHEVLDWIEDPEAVLKQAVREMESEIERDREKLNVIENEIVATQNRIADNKAELEQIEKQLDTVVPIENDVLTRACIRKKLIATRAGAACERLLKSLREEKIAFSQRLAEREAKLQEISERMRQQASASGERRAATPCAPTIIGSDIDSVSDEEIEIALHQEKQRRVAL